MLFDLSKVEERYKELLANLGRMQLPGVSDEVTWMCRLTCHYCNVVCKFYQYTHAMRQVDVPQKDFKQYL